MFPTLHIGRQLASWMGLTLLYTVLVIWLEEYLRIPKWQAGNTLAAALSVGLGVLVVFRNNAANDRWWEARKLWGQLINEVRNLALKAHAHADVEAEELHQFARLLIGFAHALRLHLRGNSEVQAIPGFKNDKSNFPHSPGCMADRVHQTIDGWNRAGKLENTVWILDVHARALMDICGACERIKNTPLASSYRVLMRWGIALYVVAAPWIIGLDVGWNGLPAIMIACGFLIGIELTAEAVEEPFGNEGDDLPLESFCHTRENFVHAFLEKPSLHLMITARPPHDR